MDFLTKHKTQWCDEAHRSVDICAACEEELKAFIVLLYLSGIYGSTNTAIDSEESVKSEQSCFFFLTQTRPRKHIREILQVFVWNERGNECV